MRRSFRTRFFLPGGFPGFAPWAGMRCPVGAWDRERGGGIGSNGAAPTRRDAMSLGAWTRDRNAIVPFAPLGHGIENVVAGLVPTEPHQPEGTRCPLGHGRGIGNVIVPLAPTGPRQRDGTRYPLGVWMRNRKRKSRSCGVQERLECESWEAGQALLFSGFLSDLFGSFFGSFFSGSGLGFGAFFLDGGLGGGEAGDGHAVWAA